MLQFSRHVLGIARYYDTAYHERCIVSDHELGAIGQVYGNPVALPDPQLLQCGGELVGQLQEPPVGHGRIHERIAQRLYDVAIDQCRLVWVLGSRIYKELLQRSFGVVDSGRYAGIIFLQPGLLHLLLLFSGCISAPDFS